MERNGIAVCGLNGSGKSTLGRELALRLGCKFIDNEELFFSRSQNDEPYTSPRSRDNAEALLYERISDGLPFVFAAVKGNYGERVIERYRAVVLIEVPKDERMRRIRKRSFDKFGKRMLEGGDLYESEEAFFKMAEARDEDWCRRWTNTLDIPVIVVNGTRPICENIEYIIERLSTAE